MAARAYIAFVLFTSAICLAHSIQINRLRGKVADIERALNASRATHPAKETDRDRH